MPDSPSIAGIPSPQLAIFHPTIASLQHNPENMDEFFSSFLTQHISADLPFLGSDTFALASPKGSEIYNTLGYINLGLIRPQ